MAQQIINHGTVAGDGTGESPFTGMQKVNANFTELYSRMGTAESNINLKAPINNPTFTGTVNGITKAMVGLSNVDNVADANKPVSSAQATAIAAGDNLRLKVNDIYNDFVITGLTTPVPVNSLDGTLSAGAAYVDGIRTTLGSASTYTYLALRDTYVDIDSVGAIYRTPVVNGNAEPSLTAGRLRLEKVITDGSKITAVTSLAPRVVKGLPITFATDTNGNPVLLGGDGTPYPLKSPAAATHNPVLKHFFACDRLQSSKLVDVVGGLTLGWANNNLSVSSPEFVSVAASSSGVGTLSAPFDLDMSKPFFFMTVLSTVGTNLAGFHFTDVASTTVSEIELWVDSSNSNNYLMDNGSGGATFYNDASHPTLGDNDIAVGILYTPFADAEFSYYDGTTWTNNTVTSDDLNATRLINPITTKCSSISNASNGVRKIYGFIVYQFDSKPTDWKAAMIKMRADWLAGIKTPFVGW